MVLFFGVIMLKHLSSTTVSYFSYNGSDYRRIGYEWEINNDPWEMVVDSEFLESLYSDRQSAITLINEVERLQKQNHPRTSELGVRYTKAVRELMAIFGTRVMIEFDKKKLLKSLNDGAIKVVSKH